MYVWRIKNAEKEAWRVCGGGGRKRIYHAHAGWLGKCIWRGWNWEVEYGIERDGARGWMDGFGLLRDCILFSLIWDWAWRGRIDGADGIEEADRGLRGFGRGGQG